MIWTPDRAAGDAEYASWFRPTTSNCCSFSRDQPRCWACGANPAMLGIDDSPLAMMMLRTGILELKAWMQ